MLLLGCKPPGRNTEQHDIFFGIGVELAELIPHIRSFWQEAANNIHIDAWRKVTSVDGSRIEVSERQGAGLSHSDGKLFFINLGGYRPGVFEEFHHKILTVAPDKGAAIRKAKQNDFYREFGFEGAVSHIDDKYGVDVDEILAIEDVLSAELKSRYRIQLVRDTTATEDELNIGYLKLDKIGRLD